MLYSKKALQMGAIAVGLASLAGQISLAASSEKKSVDETVSTESLQVMPELTLSSHYIGVPYNQSGVSVSVIDPADFEARGIESLTGALSRTSGVYLLDGGSTGLTGSPAYMAVRGINLTGGVTTMVDGMRVSDTFNASGQGSYGSGPENMISGTGLFDFGHIELVKGSQGAVFGGNSYAGVLCAETPEGQGAPSYRIYSEAGSFGSYTGYITAQGKVNKLGYFLGVGYQTTENKFKYIGDCDPYNPSGVHNRFSQWQEALRLTYDVNDKVKVSATYRRQDSTYSEPGTLYDDYFSAIGIDDYKTKLRSNLATASVDAELSKIWTTSFMVGYYDRHSKFDWPNLPAWYDYSKFQTEWRNALTWNKKWKTVLGMAWDRSEYWNESNYIAYDFIENNLAWFAEQLWTPTNYLDFSLAGRLEHSSTWNNHATWRFAGSWKVQGHKDASTRLLGSVGSGFRAPTDWERYADTYYGGYNYLGNPDLKISRSLGGDFGIEQRLFKNNHSAHYASLTGFWTRINDIIVADSSNYPVATWQNSDYGIVSGFEAQVYGEFKTAWETGYTVNYTYVMPRDNEGKQLTATARHTINAEIHTSPIDRLTFGVGMISALNRTNTYGTARLDDYVTFRLFAKYRVSDTVTLHCRLENLFDESYQVTQSPNISTPWYDASHPATQMSRGFGIYGGVTVDF